MLALLLISVPTITNMPIWKRMIEKRELVISVFLLSGFDSKSIGYIYTMLYFSK
jgi:hypothetical protein